MCFLCHFIVSRVLLFQSSWLQLAGWKICSIFPVVVPPAVLALLAHGGEGITAGDSMRGCSMPSVPGLLKFLYLLELQLFSELEGSFSC